MKSPTEFRNQQLQQQISEQEKYGNARTSIEMDGTLTLRKYLFRHANGKKLVNFYIILPQVKK